MEQEASLKGIYIGVAAAPASDVYHCGMKELADRDTHPLDNIQSCVSRSVISDNKLVDAIGVRHLKGCEVVTLQTKCKASAATRYACDLPCTRTRRRKVMQPSKRD